MKSLRGTKDYFGPEVQKFDFIVEIAKKIFHKYGYSKIIIPLIESKELFNRVGEFSDIVSKEMYTFEDKGGRSITLIPEGTTSVARAVIQHSLELPMKLYYISPMFRYERPQHGRYRQFYQLGLEFIGSSSYFADIEIIILASELLNTLNIEYSINLNYIGSVETRKNYLVKLEEFVKENLENLCENCYGRFEKNILRILDCKEKKCKEILENSPKILEYLSLKEREEFDEIQSVLLINDVKFKINANIVRGLDYYTNLVFEANEKNGIAILGGGRYNNLYKEMGKDTPAVGLAIGVERLIELISFYHQEKVKLYIVIMDIKLKKRAFLLANKIRNQGISVIIEYEDYKLKKSVSRSYNLNAEYLIFFGENEFNNNNFNLKNISTGEIINLDYDNLLENLKGEKNV